VRGDRPQPAFQEVLLGGVAGQRDGHPVGPRRLAVAAEPAQQVGADGMKEIKVL
jgi:hypothetical protein